MNIEQQGQQQNSLILEQAIAYAAKYARTFDPELLEHWYRLVVEQTLASNASHAELAANNAVRHFVVNIIRQYQLATTGSPNTPWIRRTTMESQTQPPQAQEQTPPPSPRRKPSRKVTPRRRT